MKFNFYSLFIVLGVLLISTDIRGDELYVGAVGCDITPNRPIMLHGQMSTRIADKIETPVLANIIVMESRSPHKPSETLTMISLDLCLVPPPFARALENRLEEELPQLNPKKNLILTATHTHTSFTLTEGYYVPNSDKVMTPSQSIDFLIDRIVPAVKKAWAERQKASYSYGLGHAVVAYNRRCVFADGHAVMYGDMNDPKVRRVEGMEDHDIGTLFFWGKNQKLIAMFVNIACPAQEVEGGSAVNADFWYPVRQQIAQKYGKEVVILGLCGAAGDMSPHIRYQRLAIERMARLRKLDRLSDIAYKIVTAVNEVYPLAESDQTHDIPFEHHYTVLDLPQQIVPVDIYKTFKANAEKYRKLADESPDKGASGNRMQYVFYKRVVDRYENQQGKERPTYQIPVHVVRIGNVAICTNPFELYTDYGTRIKARSEATQTMIVQLTAPLSFGGYLPSEYAVRGGGYGAIPETNYVGPEGGNILTEETIKMINQMFLK